MAKKKYYSEPHTKFTAEIVMMAMMHQLTIETAMQIIVKHKQKFIYGSVSDIGKQGVDYWGTPDPKNYVWCYCSNLMSPELPPVLTPII